MLNSPLLKKSFLVSVIIFVTSSLSVLFKRLESEKYKKKKFGFYVVWKWFALFPHSVYIHSYISISKEHNLFSKFSCFICIFKDSAPSRDLTGKDQRLSLYITFDSFIIFVNVYSSFIYINSITKDFKIVIYSQTTPFA